MRVYIDYAMNYKKEPKDIIDIFNSIEEQLLRIGWSKTDRQRYIQSIYGKSAIVFLTTEELMEFLFYLESLPASAT